MNRDMASGMRRAAASAMLGWLVLLGPGADAQKSLIPVPPGHVKVTVEFRQAGQRAQSGIAGGTVVQVDPKGAAMARTARVVAPGLPHPVTPPAEAGEEEKAETEISMVSVEFPVEFADGSGSRSHNRIAFATLLQAHHRPKQGLNPGREAPRL